MSSDLRIDTHKLLFHPKRVAEWLETGDTYPIYLEISPSGACNHRCTFCGLDYMGYAAVYLDTALLTERLTEMGRLGVKSIMYAGEGEPLLHKDIARIVAHTKASGIDVAMTTNGVLLRGDKMEATLQHLAWIKVSLNAGTPETYAKIHQTRASDFDKVLENLARAVALRSELGATCTLGAQILLLPENEGEVELLARELRDRGVDYLVVKPYSQHLCSDTHAYESVDYSRYLALKDRLRDLSNDRFQVIFRARAMVKLGEERRTYERCLALPFWSYVDSYARLWACSAYLGRDEFLIGSLAENTFEELWKSDRRKAILERVAREHDTTGCRRGCRMDEVNRYLWELKHPASHVNFI